MAADMSWIEHHRTSEGYASEAEVCVRLGKHEDARALYALAAVAEERALEALDLSKARTYGITAVSAASLYFKAGQLDCAERIALASMAFDQLPAFARHQLQHIMQQNQQRTRWGHPMANSNLPMEDQADGLSYRYWLHRDLGTGGKEGLVFVMLNPSTATATKDDPTIRKCSDYALAWGYREYTVVNLYALRTTDPAGLWRVGCSKAVGEHNDAAIKWAAANANLIVCAWGNHGQRHGRGDAVLSQLPRRPHCLRMTRSGQPASPLRLPKDLDPTPMQRLGAC